MQVQPLGTKRVLGIESLRRAVSEDVRMRPDLIYQRVVHDLHDMMLGFTPKSHVSTRGRLGLQWLGLPTRVIQAPRRHQFKLNSHGSAINGACTGGGIGIICDVNGNFIQAFSNYYGPGTRLKYWLSVMGYYFVELWLWFRPSVEVETDSLVSVMVLRNNHKSPWMYEYDLRGRC